MSSRPRLEFRIGDVFPSTDPMARYVVRLLTAYGDLQLAGLPLMRWDETPDYARMYYIRLLASHLREAIHLVEPRPNAAIPTVDQFLSQVGHGLEADCADVYAARDEVASRLATRLELSGRSLRSELSRLRNQTFHYSWQRESDEALELALREAAEIDTWYGDDGGIPRARYADEVAQQMMHPFEGEDENRAACLRELHNALTGLLPPVGRLVHHLELVWLRTRPPDAVLVVHPDGRRRPLQSTRFP